MLLVRTRTLKIVYPNTRYDLVLDEELIKMSDRTVMVLVTMINLHKLL